MAQIQNIDLGSLSRQKFTINGDPNRILELNISDLNIVSRLKEVYPKLKDLGARAAGLMDGIDILEEKEDETEEEANARIEKSYEDMGTISERLHAIDTEMRSHVDYIFDSNVSEVCVPEGTMYDPVNGVFRYEALIDVLNRLYEANLAEQSKQMRDRINKHAAKYKKKRTTKK